MWLCVSFCAQEAGEQNVSSTTRAIARIKSKRNANRDLFRFVRLPVDVVYVTCPVLSEPWSEDIIETELPMLDVHELLEWLWATKRIWVETSEIECLCSSYLSS